jgi:hypothetical protein
MIEDLLNLQSCITETLEQSMNAAFGSCRAEPGEHSERVRVTRNVPPAMWSVELGGPADWSATGLESKDTIFSPIYLARSQQYQTPMSPFARNASIALDTEDRHPQSPRLLPEKCCGQKTPQPSKSLCSSPIQCWINDLEEREALFKVSTLSRKT